MSKRVLSGVGNRCRGCNRMRRRRRKRLPGQADAVCSERHRAVVQAYDTAMKKGTTGPALAEAALSTQIDAESGLLRDLRELDPPKNLERTYSEFLTAHTHRRDLLEAAQH